MQPCTLTCFEPLLEDDDGFCWFRKAVLSTWQWFEQTMLARCDAELGWLSVVLGRGIWIRKGVVGVWLVGVELEVDVLMMEIGVWLRQADVPLNL